MKKKWRSIIPLLFIYMFIVSVTSYSQDRPRIAIIPLNYIGVSKADARGLTTLLETALVNTDAFNVLEQTQVNEILKAQEYSMSECTDEKCAIEFGKLLAAEEIVLGSVSKIGNKYVVTAKIISVETGRNIKANKVEATSLDKLSEKVDLLGFKLAGLTYRKGGEEEIAKVFGEVFVQTEPRGADVYLNGLKKGTSPFLLSKVPLGKVWIEARKGNMYATKEIELTGEGLTEIMLKLKVSLGNVFIKADKPELTVYLDGWNFGKLGTGLFKDIASGKHSIELKGEGYYWKGSVYVRSGKTAIIDAYPVPVGSIEYDIPNGASAEITGVAFRKVVRGSGTIDNVRAGEYKVRVTGKNYKSYYMEIRLSRGENASIVPVLEYIDEYKAELKKKERDTLYKKLLADVEKMEKLVMSSEKITSEDIEFAGGVLNKLKVFPFSSPLLKARVEAAFDKLTERKKEEERLIRIEELTKRRRELDAEYRNPIKLRKKLDIWGWISMGAGIVSSVLSGVSIYFGNEAYSKYKAAKVTIDAVGYREKATLFNTIAVSSGVTGGITFMLSPILWNVGPRVSSIESEIEHLDRELEELREGQNERE